MDAIMGIIVGGIIVSGIAALIIRMSRHTNARRSNPNPQQPQPAGTTRGGQAASNQPVFTLREALVKGPVWVIYVAISIWLLVIVVRYCIAPSILRSSVSTGKNVPTTFDFSQPEEAGQPVKPSSSSHPVDSCQQWVHLMTEQTQLAHANLSKLSVETSYLLVMDPPAVTIMVAEENKPYFAGQTLLYGDPGHVWVTVNQGRTKYSNIEVCQSVLQDRWQRANANPFWMDARSGQDIILIRLIKGEEVEEFEPVEVTTRLTTQDKQFISSDKAVKPAVRFTLRGVRGKEPVMIADAIITSLPSGQRVDSQITLLLINHDGTALDPVNYDNAMSVMYAQHLPWQVCGLRYQATTAGKDNPPLLVSINHKGTYDIIVVLTPQ